jgi:methyl-accepting chemotaxis protein
MSKNVNIDFEQVYQRGDQLMEKAIWIFFGLVNTVALYYGTFLQTIISSALLVLLFYTVKMYKKRISALRRLLFIVIGTLFLLVLLEASQGEAEFKKFALIYLSFLIVYQNPRYIALIGGGYMFFDTIEFSVKLLNDPQQAQLSTFLIILLTTGFETVIACLIANYFRQSTLKNLRADAEKSERIRIYEKNQQLANQIGNGNFAYEYELSQDDSIGQALLEMRDKLKVAAENDQISRWHNEGISLLNEELRKHMQDFDTLCQQSLQTIVKYLKVNQGCLFVTNESTQSLMLKAVYAYDKKRYQQKQVPLGVGLAGQCALEKDFIHLTEIPQNYTFITSGLGGTTPDSLLLCPIIHHNEVLGVIELASFHKFTDEQIAFVQKCSTSVAAALATLQITEKVRKLHQAY